MEKNADFEKEILQRLVAIETKLDDFKEISNLTHLHDTKLSVNDKNIENMNQQINKNQVKIQGIQERPQKNWDNLVGTVLSCIVTLIVNLIFIKINLGG